MMGGFDSCERMEFFLWIFAKSILAVFETKKVSFEQTVVSIYAKAYV